jgi:hypothetical protein
LLAGHCSEAGPSGHVCPILDRIPENAMKASGMC